MAAATPSVRRRGGLRLRPLLFHNKFLTFLLFVLLDCVPFVSVTPLNYTGDDASEINLGIYLKPNSDSNNPRLL